MAEKMKVERVLKKLADVEYQRKVWVNHEGSEPERFHEVESAFFCGLGGVIHEVKKRRHRALGLTAEQANIFLKFCREFDNYMPHKGSFIDDPEWLKIVASAKACRNALNIDVKE